MLVDGLCYTLPDGTVVRAIAVFGTATTWRLDTIDGLPAYLKDGKRWLELIYTSSEASYRAVDCDLTDADIEPVF